MLKTVRLLLLALHLAPSSGDADSTTAQCEPWCQNTEQHVKYCKCSACSFANKKALGEPCTFDDVTKCSSGKQDDLPYEACSTWCKSTYADVHCEMCGCKACAFCKAALASRVPCQSFAPRDDTPYEKCDSFCSSRYPDVHCSLCRCRGCSWCKGREMCDPTKRNDCACEPEKTGDSRVMQCNDWCKSYSHCTKCKCAACPFCMAKTQPRTPPQPPALPPPPALSPPPKLKAKDKEKDKDKGAHATPAPPSPPPVIEEPWPSLLQDETTSDVRGKGADQDDGGAWAPLSVSGDVLPTLPDATPDGAGPTAAEPPEQGSGLAERATLAITLGALACMVGSRVLAWVRQATAGERYARLPPTVDGDAAAEEDGRGRTPGGRRFRRKRRGDHDGSDDGEGEAGDVDAGADAGADADDNAGGDADGNDARGAGDRSATRRQNDLAAPPSDSDPERPVSVRLVRPGGLLLEAGRLPDLSQYASPEQLIIAVIACIGREPRKLQYVDVKGRPMRLHSRSPMATLHASRELHVHI